LVKRAKVLIEKKRHNKRHRRDFFNTKIVIVTFQSLKDRIYKKVSK